MYTFGWDEPTGDRPISVVGRKEADGRAKEGIWWGVIKVFTAPLKLELLSPIGTFEAGQTVEVRVLASYPDGTPLTDGALVCTTPAGENLVLQPLGSGEYSAIYTLQGEDIGTWSVQVSGMDAYGNSGIVSTTVEVRQTSLVGYLILYWWAVAVAVGIAMIAITPRMIRAVRMAKLRRVLRERSRIKILKEEAAVEYFVKRRITREAYEKLLHEYDIRFSRLSEDEMKLKRKLKL